MTNTENVTGTHTFHEPTLNSEHARLLRQPFAPEVIGKLPKGGAQLDYVGHAAVTDRLLAVDPFWNWEPVAFDDRGFPRFTDAGGLWIRLTVRGVTRLGYGEPMGGDVHDKTKSAIGNAIRNAAMRFGVALDLWAKEDLTHSTRRIPTNDDMLALHDAISKAVTSDHFATIATAIKALDLSDEQKTDLRRRFGVRQEELAQQPEPETKPAKAATDE
jgi:hypothetical protein